MNVSDIPAGFAAGAVTAPALETLDQEDQASPLRAAAAEIRAAYTYVTIAQLAYDMGQMERGEQSYRRAQNAVISAKIAGQKVVGSGQEFLHDQLQLLEPLLKTCFEQRSEFDPSLRQPSLN